ncbi:MAG: bifunctional riboflavin kinase/FAD synthetase [Arcobacter sp.]|nr:MAG: bifunctional riboflavin kinase/FAD synthetase [Arcobacter sp.]
MLNTATASLKIDAIAIGGFDGMHAAHQYLFNELGENGGVLAIETGYANMTPSIHRQEHTHYPLFYYELEDIKGLSGEAFISKLKDDFPSLKKIVVGFDFHFGYKRSCSCEDLRELFDGKVTIVDEVKLDGEAVHSHRIRQLLDEGNLERANLFLAHNYTLKGKVIKGQGIGKQRLVATMNLEVQGYKLPKEGVYASLTRLDDDRLHPSVSFIGKRHISDGSFAIETHLLEKEVSPSAKAEISFLHYIRENKAFDSFEDLQKQIDDDIIEAKKVINFLAL